jgi:hypothetical protein
VGVHVSKVGQRHITAGIISAITPLLALVVSDAETGRVFEMDPMMRFLLFLFLSK